MCCVCAYRHNDTFTDDNDREEDHEAVSTHTELAQYGGARTVLCCVVVIALCGVAIHDACVIYQRIHDEGWTHSYDAPPSAPGAVASDPDVVQQDHNDYRSFGQPRTHYDMKEVRAKKETEVRSRSSPAAPPPPIPGHSQPSQHLALKLLDTTSLLADTRNILKAHPDCHPAMNHLALATPVIRSP